MTAWSGIRDENGASAVEYSLLVVAIAAIIILIVFALGTWVKGTYTDTCQGFAQSSQSNKGTSCP